MATKKVLVRAHVKVDLKRVAGSWSELRQAVEKVKKAYKKIDSRKCPAAKAELASAIKALNALMKAPLGGPHQNDAGVCVHP